MAGATRGSHQAKGASLVELAITAPLLIALLFGIIEFGWGLAQNLDLRQKARETMRLAIVDAAETEIIARICLEDEGLVDLPSLEVSRIGGTVVGQEATVVASAELREITGLFGSWLGPRLQADATGVLERDAQEWDGGVLTCP